VGAASPFQVRVEHLWAPKCESRGASPAGRQTQPPARPVAEGWRQRCVGASYVRCGGRRRSGSNKKTGQGSGRAKGRVREEGMARACAEPVACDLARGASRRVPQSCALRADVCGGKRGSGGREERQGKKTAVGTARAWRTFSTKSSATSCSTCARTASEENTHIEIGTRQVSHETRMGLGRRGPWRHSHRAVRVVPSPEEGSWPSECDGNPSACISYRIGA
jgi:hypothetical protein